MQRQFTPHRKILEDKRSIWLSRIHCSAPGCQNFNDIAPGGGGGILPPNILDQMWRRRGWTVGGSKDDDLCPDCTTKKLRQRVFREPEDKVIELRPRFRAEPVAPALKLPPPLTEGLRRTIVAEIEAHWSDSGEGYAGDWTDRDVARDLDVPLAYVKNIREKVFGACGENQKIAKLRERVKAAVSRADEMEGILTRALDEFCEFKSYVSGLVAELKEVSEKVS